MPLGARERVTIVRNTGNENTSLEEEEYESW